MTERLSVTVCSVDERTSRYRFIPDLIGMTYWPLRWQTHLRELLKRICVWHKQTNWIHYVMLLKIKKIEVDRHVFHIKSSTYIVFYFVIASSEYNKERQLHNTNTHTHTGFIHFLKYIISNSLQSCTNCSWEFNQQGTDMSKSQCQAFLSSTNLVPYISFSPLETAIRSH